MLGMAAHAVGDEVKAVQLLEAAAELLRADGRLALVSQVLSMQVMARLDLGDLERAGDCAQEGEQLARQTGQPVWRTGTLACDSILAALAGRAPIALRMAAEAELEAGRRGLNDLLSCVQLARGLAWSSCGRDRDAYMALRRAFDPEDPAFHRRERFGALMYLADTAVRAGHTEDAREVLTGLELVATTVDAPILHAHLGYARAVLAADSDAEKLFRAALADDSASAWRSVRAMTDLAFGTWLIRQGRVGEAEAHVAKARAELDRMGALPWADRARAVAAEAGLAVVWPSAGDATRASVEDQALAIRSLHRADLSPETLARRVSLPAEVVALYLERR
ncbi:hypothetical protein ACFQ9X_10060 [Catenulispora yoronensis]